MLHDPDLPWRSRKHIEQFLLLSTHPTLDFPQGCTWEKTTKNARKIGRIPLSLWTSLESRVTWNSRVVLNPFPSELKKNTHPTESIGGRVPKETTWCFVVDWGQSHGHHGCDTSFWKPLGPKGVVTSWVELWMCRLKDDGLAVGWLALLVET